MTELAELRSAVRGRVLLPGDEGYEEAARPWNLAIQQPVPAVVEAADADDVAALVRFAAERGLAVTAQAGGHGATGTDDAILMRTRELTELTVDPQARTARVGAGVSWGRLQASAEQHGLTGLPGSSPVVSVTGYTLGGGLSWFGRAYGWAADSVTAFEVVTADGRQSRVAEGDELFWALCGGGGDFAIVTAMELDLHPAPGLYGGRVMWPAAQAPRVLDAFRRIAATAPEELTVWANLVQFPGGAPPLVTFDATYLGDEDTARRLLSPLDGIDGVVSDSRAVMRLSDLGTITGEPADPRPGMSRAELLTGLDDDVVKALLAEPIDPLLSVQIRHLGGALARPSDGPHGPLTEPYALYLYAIPHDPAAITAKQAALTGALGPYISGRKPYSFLSPGETVAAAFEAQALTRLQDIKRRYDPQGVFRSNFPV